MSAMQEVFRDTGIFVFWLILIPVLVFTVDIVKNYYRKERRNKNVGKTSGRNQERRHNNSNV